MSVHERLPDIDSVETVLGRNWPLLLLRGLSALAFALTAAIGPELILLMMAVLFAAYAIVDGALAMLGALASRRDEPPIWSLLVSGFLGLGIGVAVVVWPHPSPTALQYQIAGWSAVVGLGEVAAAIQLGKAIRGEWMLLLAGALAVAFGIVLAWFPGAKAGPIFGVLRAIAFALGVLRIAFALRVRHSFLEYMHS